MYAYELLERIIYDGGHDGELMSNFGIAKTLGILEEQFY